MAEDYAPYHTLEDDTDLVRPHEPTQPKKAGLGGTRHGYVAKNEIEDMTIFDDEPGKEPSRGKAPPREKHHASKSIDEDRGRE